MSVGVQIRQAETQRPGQVMHKALGLMLVEAQERDTMDQKVFEIFVTPSYHIRSAQRAFARRFL